VEVTLSMGGAISGTTPPSPERAAARAPHGAMTHEVLSLPLTRPDPTERKQPMTHGASEERTAPPQSPKADVPDEVDHSQDVRTAARRGRSRRARRNRLLQAGVLVGVLALWWLITAIELVDPL